MATPQKFATLEEAHASLLKDKLGTVRHSYLNGVYRVTVTTAEGMGQFDGRAWHRVLDEAKETQAR